MSYIKVENLETLLQKKEVFFSYTKQDSSTVPSYIRYFVILCH